MAFLLFLLLIISLYQVFVLPVERILEFDCSDPSTDLKSSSLYITAQIDAKHIGTGMNFTVGDGLAYGGFLNVPLKNGRDYYIFLRAVTQWKMVGDTISVDFVLFFCKCISFSCT